MSDYRGSKHPRHSRSMRESTQDTLLDGSENPELTGKINANIIDLLRSLGWDFPSKDYMNFISSEPLASLSPAQQDIFEFSKLFLARPMFGMTVTDRGHAAMMLEKKVEKYSGTSYKLKARNLIAKLASKPFPVDSWNLLQFLITLTSSEERLAPHTNHSIMKLASSSHTNVTLPIYRQVTSVQEGLVQIEPSRRMMSKPSTPLSRKRGRLFLEVSDVVPEAQLVPDLVFIFQGVDGQYIKFDKQTGVPMFEPGVKMTRTVVTMVYKLFELGYLYKRLSAYLDRTGKFGLIEQSFRAYIQSSLGDYFRLLAALNFREGMTFRRLLVWTYEPLRKMRMFINLVDAVQDHHGGGLLSALHPFTEHGDTVVREYATSVLRVTSLPYHQMLKHWLYEGELRDPHEEFFVECIPDVPDADMWKSRYKLRQNMVPAFLDDSLAKKIFLTGKTLNFIRHACRCPDYRWASMPEGIEPVESEAIELGYTATSRALQDQLFNNYRFLDHLSAIRRYLLLGQGDFIQQLLSLLINDLDKPATSLHRHNFAGILDTAVRSSNAQHDDPAVLKLLSFQLDEVSGDETGWDAFSLTYRLSAPLNTIIGELPMFSYRSMFNFLWRLKRIEARLSGLWRRYMRSSRRLAKVSFIKDDLLNCQLVTAEMIHFVYQYQYYILFEVLECSWERLIRLLKRRHLDFDGIIDAHADYLAKIGARGLLNIPEARLARTLLRILDLINVFIRGYSLLLDYGINQLADQTLSNSDLSLLQLIDRPPTMPLKFIRDQVSACSADFQNCVKTFVHSLSECTEGDVRSLTMRLNFNDHYISSLSSNTC